MMKCTRSAIVVALVALAIMSAGCTDKESNVEVKQVAEAEQLVNGYAQATLGYSGQQTFSQSSESPTPCEGKAGERSDSIYAVQGTYQLLVPATDQPAVLARVRDAWRSQGYTITEDRSFPNNGGGAVSATDPANGVKLSLSSGQPPAMLLLVFSACYNRPAA